MTDAAKPSMENPIKVHPRFNDVIGRLTVGHAGIYGTVALPQDELGLYEWEFTDLPIPTDAQIEALLPSQDMLNTQSLRRAAFVAESDPLFVRWQALLALAEPRSEQAKADWLAKRGEIQNRLPYPQ